MKNEITNEKELLASSYLVTVDDYDTYNNPALIDRATFSQFAFKNGSFNKSAQINYEQWNGFKTPEYPLDFLSGLLRINVFHEQCCDVISQSVINHGWDIVPRANLDHEPNPHEKQVALDFIHKLTREFTTIIQEVIYDYEALGVAGIEIIRDKTTGLPCDLQRFNVTYSKLHNDNIRIKQEKNGYVSWFIRYGENYDENGVQFDVKSSDGTIGPLGSFGDNTAHEVIWITKYKTDAVNYGSAKITTVLDTLKSEIGRATFNNKFFENYGLPAFAVTISGDFQDYEEEEFFEDGTRNPNFDIKRTLRYNVARQIKEVIKNPHSAVVLSVPTFNETPADIKFTPLSNDIKEASFRLLRQDNKEEICAAHGMSSDLIGTTKTGSLGGNTALADNEGFVERVIQPLQKLIEEIINTILRNEFEIYDWVIRFNQIRKSDKNDEINRIVTLVDNGLLTRYEAIELLSDEYGATADPNNQLLKEYTIHGIPEKQVFQEYLPENESSNDGMLNILEQRLLKQYNQIKESDTSDGNKTNTSISNKNKTSTKNLSFIQKIFKKEFNN